MDFVTTMFEALREIVASVGSLIGDVFQSVIDLIYKQGADGGSLTIVGILLLIALAVSLFFFVLRWIRGLIKLHG